MPCSLLRPSLQHQPALREKNCSQLQLTLGWIIPLSSFTMAEHSHIMGDRTGTRHTGSRVEVAHGVLRRSAPSPPRLLRQHCRSLPRLKSEWNAGRIRRRKRVAENPLALPRPNPPSQPGRSPFADEDVPGTENLYGEATKES